GWKTAKRFPPIFGRIYNPKPEEATQFPLPPKPHRTRERAPSRTRTAPSAPQQLRQPSAHIGRRLRQPETLQQPRIVRSRMADIPPARCVVIHWWQITKHIADGRQQLVQRSGLVEPHIGRTFRGFLALQCLHQQLNQIPNIEEVAGLLAITEHRDGQALLRPLGEDADYAGIRRRRILTRAVDIEEAE